MGNEDREKDEWGIDCYDRSSCIEHMLFFMINAELGLTRRYVYVQ
jgi:hypothetical protein